MFGISILELIVISVSFSIPGIIGAQFAKSKGRSAVGWFFLSAVFWFSIVIIILLPPIKEIPGKYRECPSCREFVKWDANICKHCKCEIPSNL